MKALQTLKYPIAVFTATGTLAILFGLNLGFIEGNPWVLLATVLCLKYTIWAYGQRKYAEGVLATLREIDRQKTLKEMNRLSAR